MVIAVGGERRAVISRAMGVVLLGSIVFWWMALRGWAEAQAGYLDVDTLGAAPFVWVVLLAIAGLALVTGALPRSSNAAANVACTAFFLLITASLAAVNLAYGADDGISAAGWFVSAVSIAQAIVFVGAMSLGASRMALT